MNRYAVLIKMPEAEQLQVVAIAAPAPSDALSAAAQWCVDQGAPEAQLIGVLSKDEVASIAALLDQAAS